MADGFGFGAVRGRSAMPMGPVRLNRGHPLANGLVLSCFNSALDCERLPFDYVTRTYGTGSGGYTTFPGYGSYPTETSLSQSGNGFGSGGTGGRGYMTRLFGARFNGSSHWARFPLALGAINYATFSFWCAPHSYVANGVAITYFGTGGTSWQTDGFLVQLAQTAGLPTLAIVGSVTGGTGNVRRDFNTNPTVGLFHHYTFRVIRNGGYPGAIPVYLIDGVQASTATSGGGYSNAAFAASGYFDIGANNAGAATFANASICAVNVWSRYLSDAEVMTNYRDTFQMYEPIDVRKSAFIGDFTPTPTPTPTADVNRWFLTA